MFDVNRMNKVVLRCIVDIALIAFIVWVFFWWNT